MGLSGSARTWGQFEESRRFVVAHARYGAIDHLDRLLRDFGAVQHGNRLIVSVLRSPIVKRALWALTIQLATGRSL